MNIALIAAAGEGTRMNLGMPKQFLKVNNKPILMYSMEVFQNHPKIDAIVVVCLDGWQDKLKEYAKQFNITKLTKVVSGGATRQDSIRNGVLYIKENFNENDIVITHDGVRPLVTEEIISNCIVKCIECGNAVTAIPCLEAMFKTKDKECSNIEMDRDELVRTQTPHAFRLNKMVWAYDEAEKRKIEKTAATCALMAKLGETIYFSSGSVRNFKLTTAEDIEIFKALLNNAKEG